MCNLNCIGFLNIFLGVLWNYHGVDSITGVVAPGRLYNMSGKELKSMFDEFVYRLAGKRQIEVIDMSHNKIDTVHEITGASMEFLNLKVLNLSHNCIDSVPLRAFKYSKLEILNISHNLLRNVPFLNYLPESLVNIDLKFNLISGSLRFPFYGTLKLLEEIDLSRNAIESIHTFSGNLPSLLRLNLSFNSIITDIKVAEQAFSSLPVLREFDLSHNEFFLAMNLKVSDDTLEYFSIAGNCIYDLQRLNETIAQFKNLKHLNLAGCCLTSWPLVTSNKLESLHLHSNDLEEKPPQEYLEGLCTLVEMTLTNTSVFIDEKVIGSLPNLKYLSTDEQIWICNCGYRSKPVDVIVWISECCTGASCFDLITVSHSTGLDSQQQDSHPLDEPNNFTYFKQTQKSNCDSLKVKVEQTWNWALSTITLVLVQQK